MDKQVLQKSPEARAKERAGLEWQEGAGMESFRSSRCFEDWKQSENVEKANADNWVKTSVRFELQAEGRI